MDRCPAPVFVAAGGHHEVAVGDARVKILAGAAETGGSVAAAADQATRLTGSGRD